ncbi:MAG: hypothetical protein DRN04_18655 [Thermoprotei archaeon]|nr:MAG: hypothetical protein DRN04_18655 [Thermoprotei archaeon]
MPRRKLPERERRIVEALREGPLTFNQLLEKTGLPRATLARYLKSLQERGEIEKTRLLDELKNVFKLDEEAVNELSRILEVKDVENILKGISVTKHYVKAFLESSIQAPRIFYVFAELALKLLSKKLDTIVFLQLIGEYKVHKVFNLVSKSIEKTLKTKYGSKLKNNIEPLRTKEPLTYERFLKETIIKYAEKSRLSQLCKDKEFRATMEKVLEWANKYVPQGKIEEIIGYAVEETLGIIKRGYSKIATKFVEAILKLGAALEISGPRVLTEKEVNYLIATIDEIFTEILQQKSK